MLEYKNGENVLTLSANIVFMNDTVFDSFHNFDEYKQAVIDGIMLWQGEYEVFGGQKLTVKVQLNTESDKKFDTVLVYAITNDALSQIVNITDALGNGERAQRAKEILTSRRSFATIGIKKWSAKSRKLICIQSRDGKFDDYEEIKHVAKHEFGHALGLGDLYSSKSDSLDGVQRGTFTELDSYAITDKFYNLVMCDHHGPISNNDIEMVVFAFRDNKGQNYQPVALKGDISQALGRGN